MPTKTPRFKSKTVTVKIKRGEQGLCYGTSDELKGLLIAEQTPEAVLKAAPKLIADLYLADGAINVETIEIRPNAWIVRAE